jgi:large subunit ribosomal protein L17
MKHRIAFRKLNRSSKHRRAMLRNMVTSLIHHERITTTVPKAKELRRVADQMVTLGKKNTLASRRRAAAYLMDHRSLSKLFTVLADRYDDRDGGYTRVLKSGTRYGDMANMAIIEYVDRPGEIRPARNFSYALKAQEAVEEAGGEAKE